MLSRVADAVFWMNRYIERAENVARFVDVSLHLSLDLHSEASQWGALVTTTGDDELFRAHFGEPDREKVLEFLAFDRSYSNSVLSCLRQARENARSVREIISSEVWEQLNKAYLMVNDAASKRAAMDSPHAFFADVRQAAAVFIGLAYVTMMHDEAWHFGRLGRLIERADKTSRILDVKYFLVEPSVSQAIGAYDESPWVALLKSASALEMYRKRHGLVQPSRVVDFLMFERKFPRSIRYCLNKAERSLHAITGSPLGTSEHEAERALGRLHAEFEYAVTSEIIERGLHEYLDDFQLKLNDVGEVIRAAFFAAPPGFERAPYAQSQMQQ